MVTGCILLFSPNLSLLSQIGMFSLDSGMNKALIFYIQRQLLAIHSTHLDSCVNTVGDTILMVVKSWFLFEMGTDVLKWLNGG